MPIKNKSRQLIIPIIFVVFMILPLIIGGSYGIQFLTLTFIWAIMATSLRILMSLGLINLAQLALMAIGSYASAILVLRVGLSFWVALPISAILTGIVAAVMIFPLIKLKSSYFFIGTFALGQVIMLVIWTQFRDLLGGPMGISNIPRPSEAFVQPIPYYYLALGLITLVLAFVYRLDHSRIGTLWHAIRIREELAESIGIDAIKAKLIALVIGGVIAGIAGSLYAHYTQFIAPESFNFTTLVLVLTFVIVGGRYSTWGPVLGCLVLRVVTFSVGGLKEKELVVFSVILIVVITLLPGGLVSLPERIRMRRKAKAIAPVQ